MTAPGHRPTRLLPDEPAAADTLGGAHERVAAAIADLIRGEDGGKAVGLEGGWGAGKSTVVRLVTEKLVEDPAGSTRVAVFDAWAHQGDPLRRTFLEQLIQRLQDAGWVDRGRWDERAAGLARRRREETHRIVPQLTRFGALLALALFVLPGLSAALTNVSWYIALVPTLVFILLVGLAWGWNQRSRTKSGTEAADDSSSGLPALLTGQATTESRTLVTETPDPTSVEFETLFRKLCSEALGDPERRLVLVIDNLDRVAPEDARAIWSALQTFVQHGATERPAWAHRLWLVVPYDRDGISRLWANDAPGGDVCGTASSFLNKTFQVRFQIPPPTILQWRDYLRTALTEALPAHHEDDFHGVYRAFALRRGHDAQPTPRDLRLFVNAIGALHRQWQDQEGLTLPALACFALLDRNKVESALRSRTPNADATFVERVIGDDWRDALVVLHFGAPLADARVMLLRGPITSALDDGDGTALRELEATHGEGFWAVFEDSAPTGRNDWGLVGQPDLARGATALDSSDLFKADPVRREAALVLNRIKTTATAVDTWQPFNEEAAEGMAALCRLAGDDPAFAAALFRRASSVEIPLDAGGTGVALTWMQGAFALLAGTRELSPPPTLEVPLAPDQWFSVAPDIQDPELDEHIWQRLALRNVDAMDEAIATRLASRQEIEAVGMLTSVMLRTQAASALHRTANALIDYLGAFSSEIPPYLAWAVEALIACRAVGLVDADSYGRLAAEGQLLHNLGLAVDHQDAGAMAGCAFAYLQSTPSASAPRQFQGYADHGYQSLLTLLRDPQSYPDVSEVFLAVAEQTGGLREIARILEASPPEETLLHQTFAHLLETDPAAREPGFVTEHWRTIQAALAVSGSGEAATAFQTFFETLPSLAEVEAMITAGPFRSEDAPLYIAMLRASGADQLNSWFPAGLHSVDAKTWTEALQEPDDLVALLIELSTSAVPPALGPAYQDGLAAHARAIVTVEDFGPLSDALPELLKLLDADNTALLARRVYDVLESADGAAREPFFAFYGDLIADRDFLLAQPGFVDRVCRLLIVRRNAYGFRWLAALLRSAPDLLRSHRDQQAVRDFRDRVSSALQSSDGDQVFRQATRSIADVLGIPEASPADQ